MHLTEDQKAFVRQGIESGRCIREEYTRQEALSLWEIRERGHAEILAEEIKRRGLSRLAAEENNR